MSQRRVAVTGVGLLTALGIGTDETWSGLLDGRRGIGTVTHFDASSLRCHVAGEIPDFDVKQYLSKQNRRNLRMMTQNDRVALAGASVALQDAKLEVTPELSDRAALFVASSKEVNDPDHLRTAILASEGPDGHVDMTRFGTEAFNSVNPMFFVEGLQGASLFYISQQFGLKGPNTYFTGLADSGLRAIGSAFRTIRRGEADVALAGGFDDPIHWWMMTKLESIGILTDRDDDNACRPYDRSRTGTVPGEGAAMMVLEDLDTATARGARVYAEIVGVGFGFDNDHVLTPDHEGRAVARAVRRACEDAGVGAGDLGAVISDANGTRSGDSCEANGLRAALGGRTGDVAVSSVKGAVGDLLGGAGALNAAVGALALHHQTLPPTLGLQELDPGCDLDVVTGAQRRVETEHALAVGRGLQGQAVALVLRATT